MTADPWTPIRPEELRVGHYLKINHRWFDHPFVRKIFRITSEEEITRIRNAGLTRLFVDLSQSTLADEAAETAVLEAPAELPPSAAAPAAAPALDPDTVRTRHLQRQRDALVEVHARYLANVGRAHDLLGMMRKLDPGSAAAMSGFVGEVMGLLDHGSAPLALVAAAAPLNVAQRIAMLGNDAVSLAATIGKRMGLPEAQLEALMMAAALHVTGMQQMPVHLVEEKPDGASSRSQVFRTYPETGARLLEQCGGFSPEVVRIVREHRERPDGSGFPSGLQGNAIHPLALVLGAIREFQIQCSMEGATPAQALAHVYRNLRSVFGDETINHLIASMTVYPPGTYVLLSDGSIGRVLRVNEGNRLRPVVGLFDEGVDLDDAEILDLSIVQDLSIQRFVDVTLLPRRLVEQLRHSWTGVALAPSLEDDEYAA